MSWPVVHVILEYTEDTEDTGVYWRSILKILGYILEVYRSILKILGYTGVYRNILKILGYTGVYRSVLECTGVVYWRYRYIQEYTRLYWECTTYWSILEFTFSTMNVVMSCSLAAMSVLA